MGVEDLVTVDRGLEAFLAREIAIQNTARSKASASQNYLRQVLRRKADADSSFPEVLTRADADFLGGSFARHTKIWPLDDIDLFLPLDGAGLVHNNNGVLLPFTIAADAAFGRLTLDRWLTDTDVDSNKILRALHTGIRDTYPASTVQIDHHCVNLQTTIAATSESEGIGFDVVPCMRLLPDDGSEALYLVPDGTGGWMRSNPRRDTELCADLHGYHHGTYRKVVRLVKYWNKTQIDGRFQSYYIELALSKRFLALKQAGTPFAYLLDAFARAMGEIRAAYSSGDLASLVSGAPSVKAPALTETQSAILEMDTTATNRALVQAYNNSDPNGAFQMLNSIFRTEFFG